MKKVCSKLVLNIVYIIQLHRKCTMLNSTLTGPVVTFHKYSYNCNGSINVGRLVLLYIPKTSWSFYSTFGAWCNACCKKKSLRLAVFLSKANILGVWWVRTGNSERLMWENDTLRCSVLDMMTLCSYVWFLRTGRNKQ